MKYIRYSVVLFFITALFFSACEEEEQLEPWVNERLTDTSGVYRPLDLFISGVLDGDDFLLQNGENGYSNFAYGYRKGFCDSVDTFSAHIEVQTSLMHIPSQRQGAFYIELVDCIPFDTIYQEHLDSMYIPGSIPYVNLNNNERGVIIKYIDPTGLTWTTNWGGNAGASSQFNLSSVVPNEADTNAERIAFGTFSCLLYNDFGDVWELNDGKFKVRMSNF